MKHKRHYAAGAAITFAALACIATSAGHSSDKKPKAPRPRMLIVCAEDEYQTERTLPAMAGKHLGEKYKISYAFGDTKNRTTIPGIKRLDDADIAIFSIRRWPLPKDEMTAVRRFVKAGKPLLAIRTTSHAFDIRGKLPSKGLTEWPEFDREVLGINYTGHYGNKKAADPPTLVWVEPKQSEHPILAGAPDGKVRVRSWLYKCNPPGDDATVLMWGTIKGRHDVKQPVTVVRTTEHGGRVFYTSLGHPDDFELDWFVGMLVRAAEWAGDANRSNSHTRPGESNK